MLGNTVTIRDGTEIPANTHISFCACPMLPEQLTPLLFQERQVTGRRLADSAFSIITPNFPIELSHDLIRWLHLESISIVQLLQLQELIVAKHIKSSPTAMHELEEGGYKLSLSIFSLVESSPKEPEGVENI